MPFWHYLGISPRTHQLDPEMQAHVFGHCLASQIHPDSLLAKTRTSWRVAPRARVEKIRSTQLASQVPIWHYLGISPGTHRLDPELHVHVFRHCSASRIPPKSLPAKTETFLRGASRARVEKIRSGQLASQVPFWHYLGISPRTHHLDPEMQAHVFGHCLASQIHPDSLLAKTRTSWRVAPRARVEKIRSTQLASQVPFWQYLGISPGTHRLDPELHVHVFRHCSASRIPPNSLPAKTETFLQVVSRARVENQVRPVGKPNAILALVGYIAGNTPAGPRIAGARFPQLFRKPNPARFVPGEKQKLFCAARRTCAC